MSTGEERRGDEEGEGGGAHHLLTFLHPLFLL